VLRIAIFNGILEKLRVINAFELRERLISDYSSYIRSFIRIQDERVDALVTCCLDQRRIWPDPLIQLNPSFQYSGTVDD
jgi:hypothetical protein